MKTQMVKLNYLKMAPRKVRLVANSLKGLSVNEAEAHLLMNAKRASEPLLKLLRSASVSAKQTKQMEPNSLFIKEIKVDQGPMFKRHMGRAMGRVSPIQKKTSHITLVLGEAEKMPEPRFKIVKPEKVKKKVAEKIKKERMEREEREREEKIKEVKPTKGPGFIRRMFRRKTV